MFEMYCIAVFVAIVLPKYSTLQFIYIVSNTHYFIMYSRFFIPLLFIKRIISI